VKNVLLIILVSSVVVQAAEEPRSKSEYATKFGVVSERNMFLRDRTKREPARNTTTTQPARRPAEESFIVRGVAIELDGLRAYIEDVNGPMLKLLPGDAVARGKISQIDIDAVEYEQGGQKLWVNVGEDLTGHASSFVGVSTEEPTTVASTSQPSSASADAAPAAKVNTNDASLTVEQRLKLRRQQELKK